MFTPNFHDFHYPFFKDNAGLYTIFSLRHPAISPHNADIVAKSCSVRPPAIPSDMILKIGRES